MNPISTDPPASHKRSHRILDRTVHYAFASRPLCDLLPSVRGLNRVTCPQCLRIIGHILANSPPVVPVPLNPPPKLLREVGRRIKRLREEKHFTRVALSRASGVSRSHLYKIEEGDHNITLLYLVQIVTALETTLDAILTDIE